MDTIEALQEFDLSKNEAAVYVELLGLGRTNVGPIVTKTKLHRQLVYSALESLVERKMATVVTKNGRKYFQASSPRNIVTELKEKQVKATELLPDLLKLQEKSKDKLEIHILHGSQQYFENLKQLVASAKRTDKVYRTIGGGTYEDAYKYMGNNYRQYVDIVHKAKLKKLVIGPNPSVGMARSRLWREKDATVRVLQEGLIAPAYTRITKEMVSIEIYGSDVTIIQILNKAVAAIYVQHFDILWEQGEEYER